MQAEVFVCHFDREGQLLSAGAAATIVTIGGALVEVATDEEGLAGLEDRPSLRDLEERADAKSFVFAKVAATGALVWTPDQPATRLVCVDDAIFIVCFGVESTPQWFVEFIEKTDTELLATLLCAPSLSREDRGQLREGLLARARQELGSSHRRSASRGPRASVRASRKRQRAWAIVASVVALFGLGAMWCFDDPQLSHPIPAVASPRRELAATASDVTHVTHVSDASVANVEPTSGDDPAAKAPGSTPGEACEILDAGRYIATAQFCRAVAHELPEAFVKDLKILLDSRQDHTAKPIRRAVVEIYGRLWLHDYMSDSGWGRGTARQRPYWNETRFLGRNQQQFEHYAGLKTRISTKWNALSNPPEPEALLKEVYHGRWKLPDLDTVLNPPLAP